MYIEAFSKHLPSNYLMVTLLESSYTRQFFLEARYKFKTSSCFLQWYLPGVQSNTLMSTTLSQVVPSKWLFPWNQLYYQTTQVLLSDEYLHTLMIAP